MATLLDGKAFFGDKGKYVPVRDLGWEDFYLVGEASEDDALKLLGRFKEERVAEPKKPKGIKQKEFLVVGGPAHGQMMEYRGVSFEYSGVSRTVGSAMWSPTEFDLSPTSIQMDRCTYVLRECIEWHDERPHRALAPEEYAEYMRRHWWQYEVED